MIVFVCGHSFHKSVLSLNRLSAKPSATDSRGYRPISVLPLILTPITAYRGIFQSLLWLDNAGSKF